MIDLAAGLAQNGKIVYVYAMAPFVTLRCYEQIKVAIASMNLPVTIIGNGVGYSYDDAGPTHYATEDISCMRGLAGIEIYKGSDTASVRALARLSYRKPAFRYIRLDRAYLPPVYKEGETHFLDQGLVEIERGENLCMISSGYMIQVVKQVRERLKKLGHQVGIIDAFCLKPLNTESLQSLLHSYDKILTVEEHFLSGGMGSAIIEGIVDLNLKKKIRRMGIRDHYYCENGGRLYLHQLAKIDVDSITREAESFLEAIS